MMYLKVIGMVILMQIFVVDQNREPLYNQSMEDMLRLADVSCEEVYNVAWTSAEELDEMMQQYEQLAEEVFWNALGVSIKYNG